MMRGLIVVAMITFWGTASLAQPLEAGPATPLAEEVIGLIQELRLAMYYTALAIYAPTSMDQRLYAQQVVNLIEGAEGEHFAAVPPRDTFPTGMFTRLKTIETSLTPEIPAPRKHAAVLILNNVRIFLEFALQEALAVARAEDVTAGSRHMRRVFAFLNAAWGADVESPYLGGMWLLFRNLERAQRPMPSGRPHP